LLECRPPAWGLFYHGLPRRLVGRSAAQPHPHLRRTVLDHLPHDLLLAAEAIAVRRGRPITTALSSTRVPPALTRSTGFPCVLRIGGPLKPLITRDGVGRTEESRDPPRPRETRVIRQADGSSTNDPALRRKVTAVHFRRRTARTLRCLIHCEHRTNTKRYVLARSSPVAKGNGERPRKGHWPRGPLESMP
jgi:hypothetical protein